MINRDPVCIRMVNVYKVSTTRSINFDFYATHSIADALLMAEEQLDGGDRVTQITEEVSDVRVRG